MQSSSGPSGSAIFPARALRPWFQAEFNESEGLKGWPFNPPHRIRRFRIPAAGRVVGTRSEVSLGCDGLFDGRCPSTAGTLGPKEQVAIRSLTEDRSRVDTYDLGVLHTVVLPLGFSSGTQGYDRNYGNTGSPRRPRRARRVGAGTQCARFQQSFLERRRRVLTEARS